MPSGSASPVEQREFPARFASLIDSAAFVEAFCDRHGVDPDLGLKVTLVLEELLTNTIDHGLGIECDAPIRVALTATNPQSVSIAFEDTAPAFDPLAQDSSQRAAIGDAFDTRPIGGLGIHLVAQLASAARYAREGDRNRLWLTFEGAADSSRA